MQYVLWTGFNFLLWHNKSYWILQPFKLGVQDKSQPRKWSQMIYYFICFPLFFLFRMAQRLSSLTKCKFQQGSHPYQKEILVQSGEILLDISKWALCLIPQYSLQLSLIISLPIQAPTWWFHFYWFLYINKKNIKRRRGQGNRYKLIQFNYKWEHKIECHPKYLLIFTAY